MSFPRYPEYKDSGVEWLGEVPSHWQVRRLKHACTVFPSNVDKHTRDDQPAIRLCNYTDVYYNERITSAMPFMEATASQDQIAKFVLRAGDTIITKDSETADDIAVAAFVPEDLSGVICGYHLSMVRPLAGTAGAFVKRLFDSVYAKAKFAVAANGLTRVGLGQYALDNAELPLPPLGEQTAIAAFLDRETGKIDALVAEQEKLIALLKEKRQAVISHAVTKGLNPDAPMKPSGIEGLGDVPAHWTLPPLFLRYSVELGKMLDTSKISGQYLIAYLRNVDVQWGRINTDELPKMDIAPGEFERYTVRDGDLLVCEGGEVGRAAVVRGIYEPIGYQKALHRLRKLNLDESPRFLFYVFRWATATGAFSGEGQSTIAHLTGEQLRKYRFPKPPLEEQHALVEFLDTESENLSSLLVEAERAITLLKERRSVLISAAVTGQIDVRGLVPAETA